MVSHEVSVMVSSEGLPVAGRSLPRLLAHTDGELTLAVGRRPQFLSAWTSQGAAECHHDLAAGFPRADGDLRESKAKAVMPLRSRVRNHSGISAIFLKIYFI